MKGRSGMNPRRCFAPIASFTRSTPAIEISPAVGRRMPAIMRSVVVLPAPLGPRKPNSSPRGTSRSIASTAVKLPYCFVSRRRLIMEEGQGRAGEGRLVCGDDVDVQHPNEAQRLGLTAKPADREAQVGGISG